MTSRIAALLAALALAGGAPLAAQGPDGATLYAAKCSRCHALASNKIGPAHQGVVGRPVGSAPGYAYSAALKASGIVWTPEQLDTWLQGPQKLVKGSKMFFIVPSATDRAAIIEYLKTAR